MTLKKICAAAVFSLTAAAVCAEGGDQPMPSKTGLSEAMRSVRTAEGATAVMGRIHGGGGVRATLVVPPVNAQTDITGPDSTDENDKPLSWSKRVRREEADKAVFRGLKAKGLPPSHDKVRSRDIKTQVDVWNEKTAEAKRKHAEAKKPGEDYVVPVVGEKPGEKISSAEAGVRIENGRLVYYYGGRRLEDRGPENASRVSNLPTGSVTKVRKSTVKPKKTAENPKKSQVKPNADLDKKKSSPAEEKSSAKPKAPETKFQVPPQTDDRRSILPSGIAPDKLPDAEDIRSKLYEAFPDMTPVVPSKSRPVSDAARFLMNLFGIRSAHAAEFPVKMNQNENDAVRRIADDALRIQRSLFEGNANQKSFLPEVTAIPAGADVRRDGAARYAAGGEPEGRPKESVAAAEERLRFFIFVSYSMSDSALLSALEKAQGRPNVTLVMRGVPEGTSLTDGLLRIRSLTAGMKSPPEIVIDPGLFHAYGVKSVPAVILYKDKGASGLEPGKMSRRYPEVQARVAGLSDVRWLTEQVRHGEKGDLGVQGPIYAVAEPDLTEVLKERAEQFDWDKAKTDAYGRFWQKAGFNPLPTATEERLRDIDPTVVAEDDIVTPKGTVIRRRGETVNPLDIRPFTGTLVIFNPTSADELERIERFISVSRDSSPVLIATTFDRDGGWKAYEELCERLQSHVYLLTPEITKRWELQKTPAVVTADNSAKRFIVRELGPLEEPAARNGRNEK